MVIESWISRLDNLQFLIIMSEAKEIINNSISSEDKFLEGFFASTKTNTYFLGVNFAVAKTKKDLSHEGSSMLDKIKVFDLAETESANIGQINMIIVSSFCGPNGLIWGYDVCKADEEDNEWNLISKDHEGNEVKIYNIKNLVEAFKKLTGTIDKPRFPFLPGSHVPCASKQVILEDNGIIYTALGIGIPYNRKRNACLLMEDVGTIPLDVQDINNYKKKILRNVIKSILKVGENLRVQYKDIFIGIKEIKIEKGEIGCALVAAPYFTLARDAMPRDKNLSTLTINEWEDLVRNKYIKNS